jgi:16S rRNA (guanine1207-N2)-methyltransferase
MQGSTPILPHQYQPSALQYFCYILSQMNNAAGTLFYPFSQNVLPRPDADHTVAFLNASYHSGLEDLRGAHLFLQQHFKPFASVLENRGFKTLPSEEAINGNMDLVLACLPKNNLEAGYFIARGLSLLKRDGLFVCAADNKSGGNRLVKILQSFGVSQIGQVSKNRSRAAWGRKETLNGPALQQALAEGRMHRVPAHGLVSIPGLFGWNKTDRGSEILLQRLPDNLTGRGADFGCGYGLLAQHILQQYSSLTDIFCIDADARALDTCRENLKEIQYNATISFLWEDLTRPVAVLENLDFIVMNPPFHEGKSADPAIGAAFIRTAAASLKPGGQLWMVANAGLPYEEILKSLFTSCRKDSEGGGFKVFCAAK